MVKKRLTIMVPAYNEEGNIENTVGEIKKGIGKKLSDYEIIIFNDGSNDKTGIISDTLAKKDKHIRVVHNNPNRGMGYCYRTGQKLARFEYYMYIPGDNQFPAKALSLLIDRIGKADIVIPYVTNMNIRPKIRQLFSSLFTLILNLSFGLKINYYNAPVIHKTKLLRSVTQNRDSGHAYQAEILVKLLRAGASYIEIGYKMYERSAGKTTAFKLKNIKRVLGTLLPLFWQIRVLQKSSVPPRLKKIINIV